VCSLPWVGWRAGVSDLLACIKADTTALTWVDFKAATSSPVADTSRHGLATPPAAPMLAAIANSLHWVGAGVLAPQRLRHIQGQVRRVRAPPSLQGLPADTPDA